MPSLYAFLRRLWRGSPDWCRSLVEQCRPLNRFRAWLSDATIKKARHEEIYDDRYYQMLDAAAQRSAPAIVDFIVQRFQPATVLDVGCGSGALLREFAGRGVRGRGLEYSLAGLRLCQQRNLDVQRFNLETEITVQAEAVDVVISMEVAEHLPASCADRYIDLLCGAGSIIAFTAATPGQGGADHVNEQPHEYWIGKFAARGFVHDLESSTRAGQQWQAANIAPWYWRNIMVFRRSTA